MAAIICYSWQCRVSFLLEHFRKFIDIYRIIQYSKIRVARSALKWFHAFRSPSASPKSRRFQHPAFMEGRPEISARARDRLPANAGKCVAAAEMRAPSFDRALARLLRMRFCGHPRGMKEDRRRGGPPWPPASGMSTRVVALHEDRHRGLSLRPPSLVGSMLRITKSGFSKAPSRGE